MKNNKKAVIAFALVFVLIIAAVVFFVVNTKKKYIGKDLRLTCYSLTTYSNNQIAFVLKMNKDKTFNMEYFDVSNSVVEGKYKMAKENKSNYNLGEGQNLKYYELVLEADKAKLGEEEKTNITTKYEIGLGDDAAVMINISSYNMYTCQVFEI